MPSPANTFYTRIREAVQKDRPVDALRDFRAILEAVFRHITAGDPRSFGNLFARIEYVFDMMSVKSEMRDQIHELRKLANKISHEPAPLEQGKYLLSLRAICETVQYFFEDPVPEDLAAKYAELGNRRFATHRREMRPEEIIPVLKVLVLSCGSPETAPNGARYITLQCREEGLGDLSVRLWASPENDLTELRALLHPYDTLQFLRVRKLEGDGNRYTSIPDTQAVLEPDLLLDITDLAECFTHKGCFPLTYLLKKLLPQTSSEAMFQGNLVNTLLDEAIRTPQPEFREAFKKTVAEKVFTAAAYGRDKLNELYTNIKTQHWDNVLQTADVYRNHRVRIEPTFFSARYGLQGRLDLMVEYDSDGHKKDIVELKSGKPPDNNLWRNNEMQVVGYNLLLESTFGERRTGSSAILYSRASANPLRNVVSNRMVENRLLELRNQVVGWLLQLSRGETGILDTITSAYAESLPPFTREDYRRFHEAWTQTSAEQKAYYRAFLGFILREYLNAKCGIYSARDREEEGDGFAALWLQDEEEKARHFSILRNLRFEAREADEEDSDAETRTIRFAFRVEGEAQNHNFRLGDTVLIYPRTNHGLHPLRQQVVKARLDEIRPHRLVISLNNKQLDESYFDKHADWVLEHDIYESNFWQVTQGLFHVLTPAGNRLFALVSGKEPPRVAPLPTVERDGLNDNQREVLSKALAAPDYFLVQGPPGTGKTSTFLTALVQEQLNQPGTIVIVAFTNRAVDEISTRLDKKGIEHLRMGGKHTNDEQALRAMVESSAVDRAREYIQGHRVFLSTVATMTGRLEGLQMLKDDLNTLIVDEASQLTEPQLWPLLPAFRRFILIGDQNQLPPVVAQDEAYCTTQDEMLVSMGLGNLRYSLFERLMRKAQASQWNHAWGMLRTHFRMHEDIADLVNHWYGGQLECGTDAQRRPWVFEGPADSPWFDILKSSRTIFIPSPKEMTSKYHRTEADRVVSLLRYLKRTYGDRFTRETVGVITPWRTQIGLIRRLIGDDEVLQDLNIDTVERFQGSENDIIIVSFAVYHPAQMALLRNPGKFGLAVGEKGMQEIDVDRKLLVTLSRAREQIVVLGDFRLINESVFFSRLLTRETKLKF